MGVQSIHRAAATASLIVSTVVLPATAFAQVLVRGVLYDDATGLALRGTMMLVDPSTDAAVVHTTTDTLGQFSLQTSRGVFQIAAVRPGYTSVLSAPVPLQNGEKLTIRLPIAEQGDPQHHIAVVEHIRPDANAVKAAEASVRNTAEAEFHARRMTGAGLHYDRVALSKANVATLGEFLQNVPGFSVMDPGSTNSMQMTRNAGLMSGGTRGPLATTCQVGWFVDGHRVDLPGRSDPLTDGLGSLQLDVVDGVEIFRGVSEMPPEFSAPDLRCGAVAIWTRRS
jgi:hypothetical protein